MFYGLTHRVVAFKTRHVVCAQKLADTLPGDSRNAPASSQYARYREGERKSLQHSDYFASTFQMEWTRQNVQEHIRSVPSDFDDKSVGIEGFYNATFHRVSEADVCTHL